MRQVLLAPRLNLRSLILLLTILSVTCLFVFALFFVNYTVKERLIDNSLALNAEYSSRIAAHTNYQFEEILKNLSFSAKLLGKDFTNTSLRNTEAARLKSQSGNFNSVFLADREGRIISFFPTTLNIDAKQIYTTHGITESIKRKQTYISSPYWSSTKKLIVIISEPIFDAQGQYLGFVAGTIYLQSKNLVSEMLASKYGYKKNYTYVMDDQNQIIFHADTRQIGQEVQAGDGLTTMLPQQDGSFRLMNSKGIDSLVGFSHIPSVNWVVVSQQPIEELFAQANSIIIKVSIGISLFYLFIFFVVWRLSGLIALPLNHLAKMASMLSRQDVQDKINEIKPSYFEVNQFKNSLMLSCQNFNEKIDELNQSVNTDPLTGLYNRRGMNLFIEEFVRMRTDFAVLAADIDFFKKVNDTYGHDKGDIVLQRLANVMQYHFRDNDVCCRSGGEEFIILMAASDPIKVFQAAERLRKAVEITEMGEIGIVTISIGIAYWPHSSEDVEEVLRMADQKLYQAKREGRNCTR
ncbi:MULTISPECIES: sensor domain-containing diguanylate cyclase [Acinetobacter]|uniref:diguanylate cyclase n=3 Tax=Acinetobacter TaxID=469 RepID=A0A2H9YNR2_9GAMM|nr:MULTISPECIES: sensor domain-containing diguanylate cyclase [Acinetobacter]PJO74298.1 GGDEF domain-containing protein [Acinetobacter pseudolwoffii]UBX53948.1 sensor domain-containing diguanylate cyclase [Acinetobacter pseudolwoffii]